MGGNIDRLASFRSLMGEILTDSLRQPVFAIQLENIEREHFDRSLAEHNSVNISPIKILRYTVYVEVNLVISQIQNASYTQFNTSSKGIDVVSPTTIMQPSLVIS